MHVLITLPEEDDDYAKRWRAIKGKFTRLYLDAGGEDGERNTSRQKREEAALWQRRYWEHYIHDDNDRYRHLDDIHYNPVKQNYVSKPAEWYYSTFSRYVKNGYYDNEWGNVEPDEIKKSNIFGE